MSPIARKRPIALWVLGLLLSISPIARNATPEEIDDIPPSQEMIRGDANDDGAVTIADASKITNYLYSSGSAPPCLDAADANGDGQLTGADASYITNFLFNGGPAPPAPGPYACGDDYEYELGCELYLSCP